MSSIENRRQSPRWQAGPGQQTTGFNWGFATALVGTVLFWWGCAELALLYMRR